MQGSKLYVGNLVMSATSDDLKTLFSAYGEVKQVNVIEGKGFGFVEMENQAEAEKAKKELDSKDFKGRNLRVDVARPPKSRSKHGGGRRF
ncbi:MAG: RNA-binding protein [Deltaproteobacteria bacterium]|nr:RNA-binding protein [Deltaproteobacteria bacterium]